MSWAGIIFWLLPKRLRSSWTLLGMAFLGVLTAVTLLALGAIYSRALAEGGLGHALAITPPSILNVRITVQNRPLGPADYQNLRANVETFSQERVSFMLQQVHRHGRTSPNLLLMLRPDSAVSAGGPVGRPFFLTDFEVNSRLVEGRWPQATTVLSDGGLELEAVVGEGAARVMGIEAGAQVFLLPFRDDPGERIAINVVGVAEPLDPREDYWMGAPPYFTIQEYNEIPVVPFYVPEEAFFNGLGARYPSLVGDYEWFLFLNTGVLTVDTVQSTRDALVGLETDINRRFPRSTMLTFLENSRNTGLLSNYQRELALARVPIFLFLSLVVLVVLYFLSLVVSLLARARSDEASLLRSRGASFPQVSGLFLVGEGIVIMAATALGPLLAWLAFRGLLLPTLDPAGGQGSISAGLPAAAFLWGAVGGLLSLVVLMASTLGLSRQGILEFLRARARPPTTPFLQRYYVDFLLLAVLGVLLWQVQGRRGFVDRALAAPDLQVDPTLLLGPALVLLAAAFLLLRALPMITRSLAWASRRLAPSWVTFALVRVSRDPLPYGSLTVIVMLAAALGVFGAAFQSTLSRSQQEQVLYSVGGDLVLTGVTFPTATREERFREILALPGVRAITPVQRALVRTPGGPAGMSVTLLAVDPRELSDAAWYRPDFSPYGRDLSRVLAPLGRGASIPGAETTSGIPVPQDARHIGLWVDAQRVDTGIQSPPLNLHLRLLGTGGGYRTLTLGDITAIEVADQGWRYLQGPLPPGQGTFQPPYSVVGIFVTTASFARMPPGTISFDDLTVTRNVNTPPERGLVIADFEQPGFWTALPMERGEPDVAATASRAARRGLGGLSFSWTESLGSQPRGALIPPGQFPLPAVGGPGFQEGQVVPVVARGNLVPVTVVDVTSFFPTVDTTFGTLLMVPLDGYAEYLRRVGAATVDSPREFWLALDEAAPREQVIADLREVLPPFARIVDRQAEVELAGRNPLAGSAWNGLTLLGIAALTVAVALALGTHAVVSVSGSKTDWTVARALGFSRRQTVLALCLERALVIALGLATGGVLGYWLSRWVLGFLGTTATGREVIPPMLFTTEGWIVGLTVGCLLAAGLLAMTVAGIAVGRLRASDILRNVE
jgi:hypothetical protein